jgi:hypothetical protein
MNKPILFGVALLMAGAATSAYSPVRAEAVTYEPAFKSRDFGHPITNKYFTLTPGAKFTYEGTTSEGPTRIEIEVTGQTKQLVGVTTTAVRDRVWVKNQLTEDTTDWYAQDKDGNVWYFGERVSNYKNGKLADHDGSWQAGVKGARPGIAMMKEPKAGDTFRKEYYKRVAEDMGTVVAAPTTVTVPHGTFDDCVQIKDWSRIEPGSDFKYYCAGVGFMALDEGDSEKLQLVSASRDDRKATSNTSRRALVAQAIPTARR